MPDVKISALPAATVPLAGTEVLPIVQSATTRKVSVADLTAGRAISASSVTNSALTSGRVTYAGASGLLTDSANLLYSGTDLTVYGLTVGRGAGAVSTNTAVGANALAANTSGNLNTAIGYEALKTNTDNSANTALGYRALSLQGAGVFQNTAVGAEAMYTNSTGINNSAFGRSALLANTSGGNNTGIGTFALQANTTASSNTAVGYRAGYSNTTGAFQTFIGNNAGFSITTGTDNTAIGNGTLYYTVGGENNVALGSNAVQNNTSGSYNVGVGSSALFSNTTASNNTAVGYNSLNSNTTGASNTAVGLSSLITNTTGASNVGLGFQALFSNTTASNNTAVGYQAMYANTTGASNTAVGYGAGGNVTTGTNNVFIGQNAGNTSTAITTGGQNIHLGVATIASANNVDYEHIIGFNLTGKGTQTTFIGQSACYQGNNAATWSITSDARLKKNIVDNNTGLDKINAIQVRNFEYRLETEITELPQNQAIKKEGVQLGVIAQELQQILPECVKTESTGVMTVDSDNLTWYMINAIKELQAQINELKGE